MADSAIGNYFPSHEVRCLNKRQMELKDAYPILKDTLGLTSSTWSGKIQTHSTQNVKIGMITGAVSQEDANQQFITYGRESAQSTGVKSVIPLVLSVLLLWKK